MRGPKAEFLALELEVHGLLADVPLHDVSALDLPGGGPGRTISEVRRLVGVERAGDSGRAVRGLFALRSAIGRTFGWDREEASHARESYVDRVGPGLRARSEVEPGTSDGTFRQLYVLPSELLGEIRNATVHAFSCMALRETASGYRLYWAIYVKPVSRFTGLYMAAIEPFRRFVVYPSILRRVREKWVEAFPEESGARLL